MRTYKINNILVNVQRNSFSYTDKLNERSTCSFIVIDPFDITKGMEVLIEEDGEVIFAGKVAKPKISNADTIKLINVSCTDYSQLIDKRIIAETYENMLAGDIVRDFIDNVFYEEGITEGNIQDSLLISKAVFNYDNGNIAMNYLSDVTGHYWEVDKDKKLNFFDKTTYTAPFLLTDTSLNYDNLQVEENADKYRNRQYLKAGQDMSTIQTRAFKGDGETQTFTVDLPIALVPTVKVNGLSKTVGIRGIDKNKEWYWQKGDKTISQETSGSKLSSSDILTIDFQGFYPIIVVAENPEEINSRKSLEGGSGIYESITQEATLDTKDSALEYTNSILQKYGFISKVVTFNTYVKGLKSGQLLTIQNVKYNINGNFLIESVTVRGSGDNTTYSVKCLDGSSIGGWEKFFKSLVNNNQQLLIRENEIVVKLITFKDSFNVPNIEDELSYILHQYKLCSTSLKCGTGVII